MTRPSPAAPTKIRGRGTRFVAKSSRGLACVWIPPPRSPRQTGSCGSPGGGNGSGSVRLRPPARVIEIAARDRGRRACRVAASGRGGPYTAACGGPCACRRRGGNGVAALSCIDRGANFFHGVAPLSAVRASSRHLRSHPDELRGASSSRLIEGDHGVMLRFTQIIIAAFADVPLLASPVAPRKPHVSSYHRRSRPRDWEGRRASQWRSSRVNRLSKASRRATILPSGSPPAPVFSTSDGFQSSQALPEFDKDIDQLDQPLLKAQERSRRR